MQNVKRVWEKNVPYTEIYRVPLGNKGSKNFLKLILSFRKQHTSVALGTRKCWRFPGKLEKHVKSVTFFVWMIDEILAIFSNLELGVQPNLQHAYYVFPF